jgi:HSP20 family molecular chaperone IbpA
MNDQTQVVKQQEVQDKSKDSLRPAMDVFEDATGITVQADLPGVAKDTLHIHIDQDSLSIEGEIALKQPPAMEALHTEVRLPRYYRAFTLSRELDTSKVEANFKNGVLTLRIPKHEAQKTRKIEVRSA